MEKQLTFERDGKTLAVVEEVEAATFGAMHIDPAWVDGGETVQIDGNTATTEVRLYREDGTLDPRRFRAVLTVEEIS